MKKSMKVATALAGAAVVVVGGSAFTNSIADMPEKMFNGYGQTQVEGVDVDSVAYLYDTNGDLTDATWTIANEVLNWAPYTVTAVATVEGGSKTADCTDVDPFVDGGAGADTKATIHCVWADGNAIDARLDTVTLKVVRLAA